jgi:5'-nucleotidase
MKNVLLSNDDGVHSRGLWALKEHFSGRYQVYVVAPDRERSASGHSISLHDPIRLKVIEKERVFSVDGTPVDAVHVALLGILKSPIDFVVTGINYGLNLGSDVFYSGTVSAAFQAATHGIPGMAVSIEIGGDRVHFETAAYFAEKILRMIDEHPLDSSIVLNVNVPNLPAGEIEGVRVTKLGKRNYRDNLIEREDPKKNKYFWIEGVVTHDVLEEGTDVQAIYERMISITPLRLDITALDYVEKLQRWNFQDLE